MVHIRKFDVVFLCLPNQISQEIVRKNFNLTNLNLRLYEISSEKNISNEDKLYIEKEFNDLLLFDSYKSFLMDDSDGIGVSNKLKVLLFLSSMRSYADKLKKNNFKIQYSRIDSTDFKRDYLDKIKKIVKSKKITEITSFEIEDKFFERKIEKFVKKNNLKWNKIQSPMFLNSRDDFDNYLSKNKRPFMSTFYKNARSNLNILMKKDGKPEGGKWSFDEENRKKLPNNISIPKFPKILETDNTKNLKPQILM